MSIFYSMKFKLVLQYPFCKALCLNLFFLLLCLGIGGVHFGSMDDYFMSPIVTGAYGVGLYFCYEAFFLFFTENSFSFYLYLK